MSNFPDRNWGVILQQAWTIILKDRLHNEYPRNSQNFNKGGKKETCKRFNKGKCTAGLSCRYEHKCLNCRKFGHGAHICHKKNSNGNSDGDRHVEATGTSSQNNSK